MTPYQVAHSEPESSPSPPWRPRIVHEQAPVDLAAAERAAADLLAALGQPLQDEAMLETPRRMAAAYAELLTVPAFDLTSFPNTEQYDELVLVQDIPVRSLCEHHLLPFVGVAARRLPAGRADPRSVQAGPAGRLLRPTGPDAGTAHQADRRPPPDLARSRGVWASWSRPNTPA